MKIKYLLITFLISLFCIQSKAQLPVQLFGGNKAMEYSFLWFKDVGTSKKVSLFNSTFFSVDYKNQNNNTYEIYQIVTYNLTKMWGVASGGRFTDGDFLPQIAISYQLEAKDLYLNVFPTVQLLNNNETIGYSLFGLLFYQPKINKNWNLFIQLAFEPLFDKKGHVYSYQQVRLGLEYRDIIQFGIGANTEQIGRNFLPSQNYGLFIRKDIN